MTDRTLARLCCILAAVGILAAVIVPNVGAKPEPLHRYLLSERDYSAARLAWWHKYDLTFGGRKPLRWNAGFITTHTVTLCTGATTITALMRPGDTMILEASHD